jgi:ABC-type phosphate/phosphonate transport system substrate-binding protein
LASLKVFAAEYHFGINAEVSYSESEAEVRHRYAAFLDELGKATGDKFVFSPVYSDRVEQAIAIKQYDFLLIHTHAALKAEKNDNYQVVGFTDDRKNNAVYFFVRPDSPIQTLAEMARSLIGSPGLQSWATATARATLKSAAPSQQPKFVTTRIQEVVPLMVELKTAAVGVSRTKKLVEDYVGRKKLRVVYVTPPLPLNAVIAAPNVPAAQIREMREAIAGMTRSKSFEPLSFKGLRFSEDEGQRLRAFYQ